MKNLFHKIMALMIAAFILTGFSSQAVRADDSLESANADARDIIRARAKAREDKKKEIPAARLPESIAAPKGKLVTDDSSPYSVVEGQGKEMRLREFQLSQDGRANIELQPGVTPDQVKLLDLHYERKDIFNGRIFWWNFGRLDWDYIRSHKDLIRTVTPYHLISTNRSWADVYPFMTVDVSKELKDAEAYFKGHGLKIIEQRKDPYRHGTAEHQYTLELAQPLQEPAVLLFKIARQIARDSSQPISSASPCLVFGSFTKE